MAVVDEVARIITSTLDIDQVCEEFAVEMKKLVDFERASISVIDLESSTFTLQYMFGDPAPGRSVKSVTPMKDTLTGTLLETGQTIIRGDISVKPGFPDDQLFLERDLMGELTGKTQEICKSSPSIRRSRSRANDARS